MWKPHTTVAARGERGGKLLLVRGKVHDRRVLNQPAGHLDPAETLLAAVLRETLAETPYEFAPQALQGG